MQDNEELVWEWMCDSNKQCFRKNRTIHTKVGQVPRPCKGCGEMQFKKTGEIIRRKKVW